MIYDNAVVERSSMGGTEENIEVKAIVVFSHKPLVQIFYWFMEKHIF